VPFPALDAYLAQLSDPSRPRSSLWLNDHGQLEGRFFNVALTSAFQPVCQVGNGRLIGHEAVVRSVVPDNAGMSLWRLLDQTASDDESVELDRLCRMLHAINFFRQPAAQDADLLLSVHNRLLSAVSSNHGYAFRRILDALELPLGRVVLQLPSVNLQQRWLLNYVMDNYRRNGFRMALNLDTPEQADELVGRIPLAAIKVDVQAIVDDDALAKLLTVTHQNGAQLIVKRVETAAALAQLARVAGALGLPIHAQGVLVHGHESVLAGTGLAKVAPGASALR
jgi:EAL domain-containing protein (putative c-di-GMP-specific phosphodiesterase class I)